jgi:hypothetical protein
MVAHCDPAPSISRQFLGEYFLGFESEIEIYGAHKRLLVGSKPSMGDTGKGGPGPVARLPPGRARGTIKSKVLDL